METGMTALPARSPGPGAKASLRVLAIEDSTAYAVLVREMLRDADGPDFVLTRAGDLRTGMAELLDKGADCVLLDLSLPDAEGLDALAQLRTVALDVPIIVLTGRTDEALAVRAVQEGAQDYLVKGSVDPRLLARAISYAIERKRVEAQLAHQAMHDGLTGLPNRVLFLDRLNQALSRLGRRGSMLGVLFLDLDGFKTVNDAHGHEAGDRLLVEVARRLTRALRGGDTAARFGGDEFVILCEDMRGPREGIVVAERVASALAESFEAREDEISIQASIGIAFAVDARHRPETLIRDADAAMYRAKERGGGTYEVFDDAMRDRAEQRLQTENALQRAIDRSELVLHFQPQYRLETWRHHGVEALVRWAHPQRGLVGPDEFISLAEETGLIIDLGARVLEVACEQWVRWRQSGIDVEMSVNLSARQCAHTDLVGTVESILRRTGADPSALCLELTETAVMSDTTAVMRSMEGLKALGVKLAIDDFGTGYSSLQALQRFPFDVVKIDRSFVAEITESEQGKAIVAAVISLSKALGLRTTAEGVETVAQARQLQELGCDLAQGFLLARPGAPADIEDQLAVRAF
jgi:diguanylate cyclase (GGDEF)-like protein